MAASSSNTVSRSLWDDRRVDAGHPEQSQCWGVLSRRVIWNSRFWVWHIYGGSNVGRDGDVRWRIGWIEWLLMNIPCTLYT
jgi:hypothetical protein